MNYKMGEFDVVVVGAGHAGVEAALSGEPSSCPSKPFICSA